MPIAAKLDEFAGKLDKFGKPAWIVLLILGFIWWWPLGLAILAFMIWSRRMGCWNHNGVSRWQWTPRSSGNRAFDEYRADTLRTLEEEHREFKEFLHRLRFARRAEFDLFMAERRDRPRRDASKPQSHSQPGSSSNSTQKEVVPEEGIFLQLVGGNR
jgi:hypothetical protein